MFCFFADDIKDIQRKGNARQPTHRKKSNIRNMCVGSFACMVYIQNEITILNIARVRECASFRYRTSFHTPTWIIFFVLGFHILEVHSFKSIWYEICTCIPEGMGSIKIDMNSLTDR